MARIKITVMKITRYDDLMEHYELPQEDACDMEVGRVFFVDAAADGSLTMPEGMCREAWKTILPFASELAQGRGHFFGAWMRNPMSAMLSCNDGFRPVSFLIEAV